MKTVLITGCSSGYGLETARFFHDRGWSVVAAMRTPRPDLFPPSDRIRVVQLDVTKQDSVLACLAAAGPIDALVNNAGIGHFGALEATTIAKAREIFDTNVFGVMAMCKAAIPELRARGAGVIVNVTSSVALAPHPLVSIYSASKWAIEGFTESLAFEVGAFDIRAKIVQPGYGPNTRFAENTSLRIEDAIPSAYMPFAQPILAAFGNPPAMHTEAADVAEVVWRAVNDTSEQMRFPAGPDAVALAAKK
jgi:NAD(P)-dependent dehydrogenase (short-subunit alcohol dehydrogenase family)